MDTYKVEYNVLTVVSEKVASEISAIYSEYKERGWKYQQYIACLNPLDEQHKMYDYSIDSKQYGLFLIRLFNLWYEDWKKGEQPYIRQFENYIGIILGYQPEACDQRGVCGIQNVIEADGSVYPCDFYALDQYRLGNFNENRLIEIDRRRKEIQFIEQSKLHDPKCKACKYFRLCKGGCRRHRMITAEKEGYNNYLCKGFQMFFDKCSERMMEIAKIAGGIKNGVFNK